MAKKKGGGGKPQKYDSSGRYTGGSGCLVFIIWLAALLAMVKHNL